MTDYSDNFDDEEAEEEEALPVPVVDVRRGGKRQEAWTRTPRQDDDEDDDITDSETDKRDESEGEQEPEMTSRNSPRKSARKRRGRKAVDMTTPEEHLRKAEKRARVYMKRGKVERAMRALVECTTLARLVHGDGSWQQARAHARLARAYFDLRNLAPQAQQHAEVARELLLRSVQVSESAAEKADILETLATVFFTLGRALATLKKFADAEHSLLKAEKIVQERAKLPTVKHKEAYTWEVKVTRSIAKVYAVQKKFANAQAYYDKVLDVVEAEEGQDSPDLVAVYQEEGRLLQARGDQGDSEKAVESYLQAHSIACACYAEGSAEVGNTALALSRAYSSLNTEDAESSAEQYLNEAISSYQIVHGLEDRKTLEAQQDLLKLLVRTDRTQEALELMKTLLGSKKTCYGELSAEVADLHKLAGSIHLARADLQLAAKSLKKCLEMEEQVHGKKSKKTRDTRATLDVLFKDPRIKSSVPLSKREELDKRPRFNGIVRRSNPLPGY